LPPSLDEARDERVPALYELSALRVALADGTTGFYHSREVPAEGVEAERHDRDPVAESRDAEGADDRAKVPTGHLRRALPGSG
jgi:hypothetical protein